jgi:hypothetical protein
MGVCTKKSFLLASDRTDSSSSRSPWAATRQLANLDFSVLANPSVDWNPACLDILDLVSCGGCYNPCHNDSLVESKSVGSFPSLLLEVSDYRHKDLYLYGPSKWMVLSSEMTMVCGLMCQNWSSGFDFAPPLLHMLYWWSRIVLYLICSSTRSLFRCLSSLFLLLVPVRADLHLVLVITSQLHCQLGRPREKVSYIFLHWHWR